jgi:hypothetical protein
VIDEAHEGILRRYFKSSSSNNSNKTLNQMWMKKEDGTIKPINMNIATRVNMKEGLLLVSVVNECSKFNIFDSEINANSVFCILTDINNKITHISENCAKVFKIPHGVMTSDILIHNLIPDLPDILQNHDIAECHLDLR